MLCSKPSSILGTVDADEESLSITCLRKQEPKRKRLRAKGTNDISHVKCTKSTMNPMVHTMLNPMLEKRHSISSNALNAVTAIKTRSCIKVMMNQTSGNDVA